MDDLLANTGLTVCTTSINLFRRGFDATISAFGLPNFGKYCNLFYF
jgi:hypothetical protein